jgi:hypothetical protein
MTTDAPSADQLRQEAARLAFTLIRFEGASAHPMPGRVGTDAYLFSPSWQHVPRSEVEAFLVALPSPALLSQTTSRGVIALTLLHELTGDRRRWAEKTLNNFAEGLGDLAPQLGLSPTSRVLVEFDEESHVFSFAAVREWTQQFPRHVGWSIWKLDGDDRASARLMLRRSDGQPFPGRSCLPVPGSRPPNPEGDRVS